MANTDLDQEAYERSLDAIFGEDSEGVAIDDQDGEQSPPVDDEQQSAESGEEDSTDESSDDDLFSPGTRAYAAEHGLTDADLERFENEGQLRQTLEFLDRQRIGQFTAAQQRQAEQQQQSQGQGQGQAETPATVVASFDEAKLKEEGWDDSIIEQFRQLHQARAEDQARLERMDSFLRSQQEQVQRTQNEAMYSAFDRSVDTLGMGDVIGEVKDGKFVGTQQQLTARQNVWNQMAALRNFAEQQSGLAPAIDESLVTRAMAAAFPVEYRKKGEAEISGKIREQSRRRRPGGNGRNTSGRSGQPFNGEHANHPDIKQFFSHIAEKRGDD